MFLRSRFFWRVYGSLALLILAATALVGVVADRAITRETLAEIHRALETDARLLREISLPYLVSAPVPGHTALEPLLKTLGGQIRTRFTVIAADGTVIADSDFDPASMENHGTRPEILAARDSGSGSATRYSATLHVDMAYVAVPVLADGKRVGYARAALPEVALHQELQALHRRLLLIALLAQAVALAGGVVAARQLTRPLASITAAAGSLAGGDYAPRLEVGSRDEFGTLARSLNEMLSKVRESMEKTGRERRDLLASLDGIHDGVIVVDPEERVMHMNGAAAQILRVDAAQALGRRIWEVARHPRIGELVGAALMRRAESGGMLRLVSGPGELTLEVRTSAVVTADGAVQGAFVVLHDVTEIANMERVRRDFVANVSHELRTPITALRGLVETLADDDRMDAATRRRFVERILGQTERLGALVNDLLVLSRAESAESNLERRALDLREPVGEAVRTLAPSGERKGVEVAGETPASPVKVLGDLEGLRQVAENLLENAIKYTGAGGRVDVRVREENGRALLEVEDTGIGIETGELGRIFERFYRVDRARARSDEPGGTGLGLSIVKRITLALGGEVSVRSTPGAGSTFTVALPLAGASPARAPGDVAGRDDTPGPG